MRIYISGRMTGCPDHNRPAFDAAEKRLAARGHSAINPHRIGEPFGTAEDQAASFAEYYRMLDLETTSSTTHRRPKPWNAHASPAPLWTPNLPPCAPATRSTFCAAGNRRAARNANLPRRCNTTLKSCKKEPKT